MFLHTTVVKRIIFMTDWTIKRIFRNVYDAESNNWKSHVQSVIQFKNLEKPYQNDKTQIPTTNFK